MSKVTLCGAMLFLLFLTLPVSVGEFEEIPGDWFPALYNILLGLVGTLTGLLIATVLLLFTTLRQVISKITPTDSV